MVPKEIGNKVKLRMSHACSKSKNDKRIGEYKQKQSEMKLGKQQFRKVGARLAMLVVGTRRAIETT